MKTTRIILTLVTLLFIATTSSVFAQNNKAENSGSIADMQTAEENKEMQEDLDKERSKNARATSKEYKAKEARRVEKEANYASKQARKSERMEKQAQKARKNAEKQSKKAEKAARKSDRN